ncbi:DUF6089 family protein [Cellulophaga sp. BC115SP]|uniref:DUF6089 family protein n=1 Tax=Cellulophaga sp. BC115SP TaxID=2683263 RepID=UPI00196A6B4B|nr:DUF6089 family protein [Cellulophaga sp. BC115SP]
MKKNIALVFFLMLGVFGFHESHAQFKFSNLFGSKDQPKKRKTFEAYSSVSIGVGSSHYYGELSPYNRFLQSTINGVRWNASFNFTRQLSPQFGLRFGLTWARIFGDDNYMDGVSGFEANFMRNLHFRNDIKEFSIVGQYDFVRTAKGSARRAAVIPYIFGGVAVFAHDPMAKPDKTLFPDQSEWVRLQPLHTEGQGLPGYAQPYSLISVSAPLGIGVRYKLNHNFDLGFEIGYRFTMTDYLDDVGGYYADPADLGTQSALSVAMANRTLERTAAYSGKDRTNGVINYLTSIGVYNPGSGVDPFTYQSVPGFSDRTDARGNSKYKDSYMLTSVKLIYYIPTKIKCPPLR